MKLITMKDYIYAAPEICNKNVENAEKLVQKIVDLYSKKSYRQITFVASGSSYTALQCARGYISKTLQVEVKIVFPYTFAEYDYQYVQEDHFVVVVTQSGASTNCISALEKLKKTGRAAYCLTANINSDCRKYADEMLDWGCGIETIGYVTLGVETLITYLMLFAAYAAKKLKLSDQVDYTKQQIHQAMENHKQVCQDTEAFIQKHYYQLLQMDRVYILGVGCNYGTALEGALKIGETVKVLSVAYEQDEFLHGPALQLAPSYTAFVIDGGDQTQSHAYQVFDGLSEVTHNNYMITHQTINHPRVITVSNPCDEPFTCLYFLPFFQLIAEVLSTDLDSRKSHPLYYKMNKKIDFRTAEFRKRTKAVDD